jgi:hypothetical protein
VTGLSGWGHGALRRALLIAVAVLLPAALARADGDPASDMLPLNNVFYPYSAPPAKAVRSALEREAAEARAAGLPVKVALISTPQDLGAVPQLFGRPQLYARFLGYEINPFFKRPQALLVVMPSGFGAAGLPRRAAPTVASLPKPLRGDADHLARAALEALPKLAAAAGYRITRVALGAKASSPLTLLLRVLAGALALTIVITLVRRRRTST